ncbi:hypothetical protein FVEN_g12845 [Fusarium venenatum]|uniref:Uncharacterized protein n=1 Tax=Fusarium venenatum TaxID=56646 RepID=A0A2L2TPD5_9HYPO|nr:uncharacterized protein FVRRES_05731 [Fusarium venenatum]KAG8356207.1 hypothetical protein FVEN_g12845 [Fusarium venenatum]CEI61295.1 unnamed protein product [Fusarium venenatum]
MSWICSWFGNEPQSKTLGEKDAMNNSIVDKSYFSFDDLSCASKLIKVMPAMDMERRVREFRRQNPQPFTISVTFKLAVIEKRIDNCP